MDRIKYLRKQTINSTHKAARESIKDIDVSSLNCGIAEKKAIAIKTILDTMPLYIGEMELIVGSRTLYRAYDNSGDKSKFDITAMPRYINENDVNYFGFNGQNSTKSHYTPDYDIVLSKGIDGIIAEAKDRMNSLDKNAKNYSDKCDFYQSIITAYNGVQNLIIRYRDYALKLLNTSTTHSKDDLNKIIKVCDNISKKPAANLHEACQLYWFLHLSLIIENFCFVNYGRIDQIFYKYLKDMDKEEAQDIITMFILKLYDMADIESEYEGCTGRTYAGQHNITIGGVNSNRQDASNEITLMILNALEVAALPEPIVAVRVPSDMNEDILNKACELSVNGLNVMAYYNDDQFITSLINQGVDPEYATDYSFDLCQDIGVAGKGDFYCAGSVGLTETMLNTLNECEDSIESFDILYNKVKNNVRISIKNSLEFCSNWFDDIDEYNKGNCKPYLEKINKKIYNGCEYGQSIMSPLPLTSSLYYGCVEDGVDIARNGYLIKQKGFMVSTPVLAINSLAAIKKVVFDDKKYSLKQVKTALDNNFSGDEALRQTLFNAPKWGNDDDYVDSIAKDIIEYALIETRKYKLSNGNEFLSGVHQPHPIPVGKSIKATPDGRFSAMPSPVTLSPENGTMKNGPTAALKSATKIDKELISWNNCVMISYFSTAFDTQNGKILFREMLKSYFKAGGMQHQPNVVNVEMLKKAQENPADYKDLVVRLWGVSAHFVDISKEMQDEFISRLS